MQASLNSVTSSRLSSWTWTFSKLSEVKRLLKIWPKLSSPCLWMTLNFFESITGYIYVLSKKLVIKQKKQQEKLPEKMTWWLYIGIPINSKPGNFKICPTSNVCIFFKFFFKELKKSSIFLRCTLMATKMFVLYISNFCSSTIDW